MVVRDSSVEFSDHTVAAALLRQANLCGSCGVHLLRSGEGCNAHHIRHVKFGGTNSLDNCVVLCRACHYSAHEGGNYRFGTVLGAESDFPHFRAPARRA